MVLSSQHMIATLIIAILLHIGVALWFALHEALPPATPVPPMRVNMLTTVAESMVVVANEMIAPPPPEKVKPEPVIQKPAASLPVKREAPAPEKAKPVKRPVVRAPSVADMTEAEQLTETVAQVAAEETSVAPLDTVASARYEQLLAAWLEQHKKYPNRAKRLRIEGEAVLRIVIDRSGQTQQVSLVQRSGNRLLDKAALEMAQRANPFPPMPENDMRAQLEFVVPVAFMLR